MRRLTSIWVLMVLAGVGLASCAGAPPSRRQAGGPLPVASPESVRAAGLAPASAEQALKLYETKCTRCHKSYDPRPYTSSQWESWMSKMSRKAHLDEQQRDLIARYLQAVRATPAPENIK